MFSDLVELFNLGIFILLKGGWIGFALGLVYMFYRLYMDYINITWHNNLKWVFLKISVPKENEKSQLAFEQIFNHLHSLHSTFSLAEKYLEGQFQIWFVWEMVSIGGVISNYVRILEKHRDTLEAVLYAQFPNAEIMETEDYFDKLPKYYVDESEYDIFAFHFILKKADAYPIRSYLDFEHSTAETFVDPVDGLWEAISKLSPYEMFVTQYIFRPIDDSWKESGYKLVKKLKGEPEALEGPKDNLGEFLGKIFGPFLDVLIRPTLAGEKKFKPEPPPSLMLHLSEGEKAVISAIERNLSKLGYQTKITCLYIAPRQKYNPGPIYTAVIGAFKSVGATNLNSLKPDTDKWTKVRYWVFRDWEKPITDLRLKWRKRRYMNRIRRRFYIHGPKAFVLNTEEMATILHFPKTEVTVPQIEKVAVTKVQPPLELPIVE